MPSLRHYVVISGPAPATRNERQMQALAAARVSQAALPNACGSAVADVVSSGGDAGAGAGRPQNQHDEQERRTGMRNANIAAQLAQLERSDQASAASVSAAASILGFGPVGPDGASRGHQQRRRRQLQDRLQQLQHQEQQLLLQQRRSGLSSSGAVKRGSPSDAYHNGGSNRGSDEPAPKRRHSSFGSRSYWKPDDFDYEPEDCGNIMKTGHASYTGSFSRHTHAAADDGRADRINREVGNLRAIRSRHSDGKLNGLATDGFFDDSKDEDDGDGGRKTNMKKNGQQHPVGLKVDAEANAAADPETPPPNSWAIAEGGVGAAEAAASAAPLPNPRGSMVADVVSSAGDAGAAGRPQHLAGDGVENGVEAAGPAAPLPNVAAAAAAAATAPAIDPHRTITDADPAAPLPNAAAAATTTTGGGGAAAAAEAATAADLPPTTTDRSAAISAADAVWQVARAKLIPVPSEEVPEEAYRPGRRNPLSTPLDKFYFSPLLCHVRSQIEFFPATASDAVVRNCKGGTKKPVTAGRVGIRCIWCADLPDENRAKGAVYYPDSLRLVHQAVRNWQRHHAKVCPSIPRAVRDRLTSLASLRRHSSNSASVWADLCTRKGMYDAKEKNEGIRLKSFDYGKIDSTAWFCRYNPLRGSSETKKKLGKEPTKEKKRKLSKELATKEKKAADLAIRGRRKTKKKKLGKEPTKEKKRKLSNESATKEKKAADLD